MSEVDSVAEVKQKISMIRASLQSARLGLLSNVFSKRRPLVESFMQGNGSLHVQEKPQDAQILAALELLQKQNEEMSKKLKEAQEENERLKRVGFGARVG